MVRGFTFTEGRPLTRRAGSLARPCRASRRTTVQVKPLGMWLGRMTQREGWKGLWMCVGDWRARPSKGTDIARWNSEYNLRGTTTS